MSISFEQYRRMCIFNSAEDYQMTKQYLCMLNPMRKLCKDQSQWIPTVPDYEIQRVQSEPIIICNEAIAIINNHMIPSSPDTESLVRYHAKIGDYYRYLAEIMTGDERKELGILSLEAYEKAIGLAEAELSVPNEEKLRTILNMGVLLYEVMGREISAIELTENAYSKAALEMRKEETSEKSKFIWRLLSDNIAFWAPRLHPNVSKKLDT